MMWLVLAALIGVTVITTMVNNNRSIDNSTGVNYVYKMRDGAVSNIYQYMSLVMDLVYADNYQAKLEYLEKSNGELKIVLNNQDIQNVFTNVKYNWLGNYRSVIFKYNKAVYVMISWDSFKDPRISVDSVGGELAMQLGSRRDNTIDMLKTNGSCDDVSIINNFSRDYFSRNDEYDNSFKKICASLTGYQVGLYNIIIQIG